MLDTYHQLDISYSQLKKVLRSLGFDQRVTSEFIAFREVSHDALILLPLMANHDLVGEAHLIAINNTIVGKGVISEESLLSRFEEVAAGDKPHSFVTMQSSPSSLASRAGKHQSISSSKLIEAKATSSMVKAGAKTKAAAGSALSQRKPSAKTPLQKNTTFAGKTLVNGRTSVTSKTGVASTKTVSGRPGDDKSIPGASVPVSRQTKRKK